jgi:predicted DNA-binding transcriptional regulator AlpA
MTTTKTRPDKTVYRFHEESAKTLINMAKVAKRLGISRRLVYKLMADPDERFPASHRIGDKLVMFEADQVEAYIDRKRLATR